MAEVERKTYTPKEVATILGVDPMTVYRHCEKGVIPSIKLGNKLLIPRQHIDDLVNGIQAVLDEETDGDGKGQTVCEG